MLRLLSFAMLMFISAASALAADLPARKPGLWQLKLALEEFATLPPQLAEHCIDAATDKLMDVTGSNMQQAACSKPDVQKVGSTFVVDSVCKMGSFAMNSHAVISGDLNSAYTVKVTSKQVGEPVAGIPASSSMTIEAKWVGACKADQKPGDMIMAGRKVNVRDMQNALPGAGQKK
jgi:hypothetical protein